jgi:type I restriction enzyme, S subunit
MILLLADILQSLNTIKIQSLLHIIYRHRLFLSKSVKIAHGTKVIEVAPKELEKILIPIPPLEEQERIVAILDRFDTLCNDLTSGLPAEIEARRKQYEYYRDKLLSFPKRSADKKVTA